MNRRIFASLLFVIAVAAVAIVPSIRASSATATPGQTVTVAVASLTGDLPMTYQWNKNGAPITGATGTISALPTSAAPVAAYTIATAVAPTDSGTYTCTITNAFGSTTSDNATLAVGNPPAAAVSAITKK